MAQRHCASATETYGPNLTMRERCSKRTGGGCVGFAFAATDSATTSAGVGNDLDAAWSLKNVESKKSMSSMVSSGKHEVLIRGEVDIMISQESTHATFGREHDREWVSP